MQKERLVVLLNGWTLYLGRATPHNLAKFRSIAYKTKLSYKLELEPLHDAPLQICAGAPAWGSPSPQNVRSLFAVDFWSDSSTQDCQIFDCVAMCAHCAKKLGEACSAPPRIPHSQLRQVSTRCARSLAQLVCGGDYADLDRCAMDLKVTFSAYMDYLRTFKSVIEICYLISQGTYSSCPIVGPFLYQPPR